MQSCCCCSYALCLCIGVHGAIFVYTMGSVWGAASKMHTKTLTERRVRVCGLFSVAHFRELRKGKHRGRGSALQLGVDETVMNTIFYFFF